MLTGTSGQVFFLIDVQHVTFTHVGTHCSGLRDSFDSIMSAVRYSSASYLTPTYSYVSVKDLRNSLLLVSVFVSEEDICL